MSENPADKRKEPRFEVETHVPAVWGQLREPVFCGVSDISKGGLFLQIEDPPPVETQIVVGPGSAAARGRVVFCLTASAAHQLQRKAGVGIQLDRPIDPDSFLLRCREAEAAARAKAALEDVVLDDFDLDVMAPPTFEASIPLPSPARSSGGGAAAPIPLPRPPSSASSAPTVEPIPLPRPPSSTMEAIPLPTSKPASSASEAIPLPTSARSSSEAIPLPTSRPAASAEAIPLPTSRPASSSEAIPLPSTQQANAVDIPMSDTPWPSLPPPSTQAPPPPPESRVIAPAQPTGVRPAGAAPMLNKDAVKRARKQVVAEERREGPGRADSGRFKPPPKTSPPVPETPRADSNRFRLPHTPAPVDGGAEVVVVEGVSGQGVLAQALTLDDYTPLVARHGLEALALTLRRRPLLLIVGAGAARLSGEKLVRAVRDRPELNDVKIVLVDGSKTLEPLGCVRWKATPTDPQQARRLIDEALGAARSNGASADDARDIALAIVELGKKLHADGDVDDAVSALRYAAELAPTVSGHTLALARVLLGSPDVAVRNEAAGLIERVCRQDPRNADACYLRAISLEQRGHAEDAKSALQRALLLVSGHEEATAGLERMAQGKPLLELEEPHEDAPKKKGLFGWLQGLFKKKERDDDNDHAD